MLEVRIEARLRNKIREAGGRCYKFVSPGNPGVPDRIVIIGGRVYFVELKTETGRLSAIQKYRIDEMRKCGADVRKVDSVELVDAFVKEVMPNEV